MKNLTLSLFEFEKIKTSIPKAKELRRVAEPLITLAKQDNLMRRRLAYSKIRNKKIVKKTADWLIDLGPEGGIGGGNVVAEGTPEEVSKNKKSFTGVFLKNKLNCSN